MANNNIQNNQNISNKELLDFLIKKFDGIDQKFVAIDQKFDAIDQKFDAIDQKFLGIDKRFDAIDQKFLGIDKQFDVFKNEYVADYKGLADLMMNQFEKFYEKLDQKADKSDIDAVLTRITQLSDKVDDYRADQIGLKRQVDKHEKWHRQTATKIGLKLIPEA
jgi:uncharacterized coiled-coil DUF342 family protein